MKRLLSIIFAAMVVLGVSASVAYADLAPWSNLDDDAKEDDSCTANPLRDASGGSLMLVIAALVVAGGIGGIVWQNKAQKN